MKSFFKTFAVITLGIASIWVFFHYIDKEVVLYIRDLPKWTRRFAKSLSFLVSPFLHLVLSSTLFLIMCIKTKSLECAFRYFRYPYLIGGIMFIGGLLKIACKRARPSLFLDSHLYGFGLGPVSDLVRSFPSSHTAIAFGLALLCGKWYPRYKGAFIVLAILFSLSRLFALKHYPSDLIGGALLGIIVASSIPLISYIEEVIKAYVWKQKKSSR